MLRDTQSHLITGRAVVQVFYGCAKTDVEVLWWKYEHLVRKGYWRIYARGSYHNFLFVLYNGEYELAMSEIEGELFPQEKYRQNQG